MHAKWEIIDALWLIGGATLINPSSGFLEEWRSVCLIADQRHYMGSCERVGRIYSLIVFAVRPDKIKLHRYLLRRKFSDWLRRKFFIWLRRKFFIGTVAMDPAFALASDYTWFGWHRQSVRLDVLHGNELDLSIYKGLLQYVREIFWELQGNGGGLSGKGRMFQAGSL